MRLQVHALVRNIGGEPGQLPEKVVTRLGGLQKQVERMVQMFDALLDISRITSGRLTLAREQVDASALVRDCAGRVAEDAEQADCELRVRADDAIVGSWDRLRIEQVVTNLLSNAIKYGKGAPIDVSVSRAGAMVSLGVRDHGAESPRTTGVLRQRSFAAGTARRSSGSRSSSSSTAIWPSMRASGAPRQ
jgi:signal transduction histidine kinase